MTGRRALAPLAAALLAAGYWLAVDVDYGDTSPPTRSTSYHYDFFHYYRPNADLLGERLARGELPLWNPHQALGQPFLASLQVGALYPPNWIHAVLPTQAALALLTSLHLGLAAGFAAALARRLGADGIGAACAGLLYAGSTQLLVLVWAPPVCHANAWLPAVLLAVDRIGERPNGRNAGLLALAVALQLLCGWPYVAAMTALAAALMGGAPLLRDALATRRPPLRGALWLGVGAAAGLALAAPLMLPALELVAHSCRAVGSLVEAQAVFGSGPHDPARFGGQLLDLWGNDAIPSLTALGFVAAGLVLRASLRTWMLLGVGLLALAASFPEHLPVYGWLRHLPVLGDFRFPFRYRLLTCLAVAVLAGVGVSGLAALARTRAARVGLGLAGAALALAPIVLLQPHGMRFPFQEPATRPLDELVALLGDAPDGDWTSALFTRSAEKVGAPPGLRVVQDLEPLTLVPTARALTFFSVGRALSVDPAPGAKGRSVVRAPFSGRVELPRTPQHAGVLDALGVDLLATREAHPWPSLRYRLRTPPEAERRVYTNANAVPRAYRVAAAEPEPADPDRALARIASRGFDPARRALLEPLPPALAKPGAADAAPGEVEVESWQAEWIVLRARGETAGAVVVTDAYYPGWRAWVDGEPAPMLRANTVFRAVEVPAGEHRVELRYEPTRFRLGLGVATVAGVGLIVAARGARTQTAERAA